jgi:hypothetical protein
MSESVSRSPGRQTLSVAETLEWWHLNVNALKRVISAIAAMPDGGFAGCEKVLGAIDACHGFELWGCLRSHQRPARLVTRPLESRTENTAGRPAKESPHA